MEIDSAIAKLRKARTKTAEFSCHVPWTATGRNSPKTNENGSLAEAKRKIVCAAGHSRKTEGQLVLRTTVQ